MVDQLRAFTAEVTRVTREVGSKGVGEQANVPGVAGSWKDLTVSVNQMIVDLGKSTRANEEQDWLKTNLARLSALMQGQAGLEQLSSAVLAELCPEVGAQYGSIFVARREKGEPLLERVSGYGLPDTASRLCFRIGEGLVGQCARERRLLVVEGLPAGYASVRSGTGEAEPHSLILLPLLFQGEVRGVLELASFRAFGAAQRSLLDQLAQMLGVALNTIATSMRSEELLEELRASNAELEKRTAELEDKARQVAQVSRYKSQFLANVSHELRTPLNSLLILAQLLAQNEEGNLTPEQVDHARTILSSGQDLLALINQILDLSKIESGKMQVDVRPTAIREVIGAVERTLQPMIKEDIAFHVTVDEQVPEWVMTDAQRLQQVLKNLLANAFKFTDHGQVALAVSTSQEGALPGADVVLSFAVSDTGIGIPEDKQALIFEAFQQADASTSRKYGGTGLGLTISRDLAALLGGQLALRSTPGAGSTFTLRLPVAVAPAPPAQERIRPLPATGRTVAGKSGPKVLLVDDDGHNLYAVTTVLEKLGARVVAAQSARDCFRAPRAEPGRGPGADGRDDAGDGRAGGDAAPAQAGEPLRSPGHRAHRQGLAGRQGALPRRGMLRLRHQAGDAGAPRGSAEKVGKQMNDELGAPSVLLVDDRPENLHRAGGDAQAAQGPPGEGALRRGGAGAPAPRDVRGHPPGRADAQAGRPADGGADRAARADAGTCPSSSSPR